jgi:hypothetical protein
MATIHSWSLNPIPLPQTRYTTFAVVDGNRAFLLGGSKGAGTTGRSGDIDMLEYQPGVGLSAMKTVGSLPDTLRSVPGILVRGYLILVGGSSQATNARVNNVWSAKMTVNGPGAWKPQPPFPVPSTSHSLAAWGDKYIFAVGGSLPTFQTTVYVAEVSADGGVSNWRPVMQLPNPLASLFAFVRGDYLYTAGGSHAATWVDKETGIWRAKINSDGSLGIWTLVSDVTVASLGTVCTVWNNRLYALGGTDSNGHAIADAISLPFSGDGTLGQPVNEPALPMSMTNMIALPMADRLFLYGAFITDGIPGAPTPIADIYVAK